MRLYFLFLIFTVNYGFSQSGITSQEIIQFNERIVQKIIDGDRELDTADYLSKEEIALFLDLLPDSLNKDSMLLSSLSEYDEKLEQFREFYRMGFSFWSLEMSYADSINWDNCSIDSSGYLLRVLNPTGRDRRIYWPQSKSYEMGIDEYVLCRGEVLVSEGEKKYGISVDSIHCNGKLKFYHTVRAPKIMRLE